jgi:ATP-binding protein involved in chromosome partitioning
MFRKVNVPLLGLVENMSYYTCTSCGHKEHIFGKGGGEDACEELGLELLGQVRRCQHCAAAAL